MQKTPEELKKEINFIDEGLERIRAIQNAAEVLKDSITEHKELTSKVSDIKHQETSQQLLEATKQLNHQDKPSIKNEVNLTGEQLKDYYKLGRRTLDILRDREPVIPHIKGLSKGILYPKKELDFYVLTHRADITKTQLEAGESEDS